MPLSSFSVGRETGGYPKTLIMEFAGRTDRKHARLRHTFSSMDAVTVCTRVRFDPDCFGISTIFSYSIKSNINEFQLRGHLVKGKPVQLALLVHGAYGPYQDAFHHDGSWHSVCVSWNQSGGRWALFTHGQFVSEGEGLSSGSIGPDGLFIIGQEQDTFGGSFKKDESFSGSITELYIWDRVLNASEMKSMEKECSPISSGLVFKWNASAMEIETTLTKLWKDIPCRGTFVSVQYVDVQIKADFIVRYRDSLKRRDSNLSAWSGGVVKRFEYCYRLDSLEQGWVGKKQSCGVHLKVIFSNIPRFELA